MPLDKPKASNKQQRWSSKSDNGWRGFVSCRLDSHMVEVFELWCEDHPAEECFIFIATQLVDEYKFSMWFDTGNDSYVCGLTGTSAAVPRSQGLMLTARAGRPEKAVQAVLFKHVEMTKGDYEAHWTPKGKEGVKGSEYVD